MDSSSNVSNFRCFATVDASILILFIDKVNYIATWEEAGLGMVWYSQSKRRASIVELVSIILLMKNYLCQLVLRILLEWRNSHHFPLKLS